MSNQPQDLSFFFNLLEIFLAQLEILQEKNEFLQNLIDGQNSLIQEILKKLEETEQELQFTNDELLEILRDRKTSRQKHEKEHLMFEQIYFGREKPKIDKIWVARLNLS